jgi:glyoxylase-like metal-dependent hydrolase (beta-lactamase superfamily II)
VETQKGSAVICGDVVPRYQNIREDIPCGIHTSAIEAVQALERIKSRAGSMDLILTGHDPQAMQKYPRVVEGVYLIEGGLP